MNLTKKVAYNTIMQTVGKFLGTALGVVVLSIMTRYLQAEQFGYYATVIAFLSFFGILVEFGLHLTTLQIVSEDKYDRSDLLSNIFTFRIITGLIAYALAPIIVLAFPYDPLVKWGVLVTALSFFAISLNQICIAVLQIELKTEKAALAEVVGRVVLFVLISICALLSLPFLWAMASIVVSSVITFFMNFLVIRKYVQLSFTFNKIIWKDIFYRSWPIALSIFFNLLYLKADIIILSLYHPAQDVGLYGLTYRFLDILTTFPAMFMGLILPVLTASWIKKDTERFQRIFQKAFDLFLILALPIVVGTHFTAYKLISFIAGPQYVGATQSLQIIIWSVIALFIGGGLYGYSIIALNKQKVMMWGYGFTALISVLLYWLVIPQYSYIGASYITVLSEFIIMAVLIVYVTSIIKFIPSFKRFIRIFFATSCMGAFLFYFPHLHIITMIICSALIYSGVLFLVKGIDPKIIQDLKQKSL